MKNTVFFMCFLQLTSCSVIPNHCGPPSHLVTRVKQYDTGPLNGGFDENGDGYVDQFEAFSHWDFEQINRVLNAGKENTRYNWTNINTCYKFSVTPKQYVDMLSPGVLYPTCRQFTYQVFESNEDILGNGSNIACRHFINHRWEIL